MDERFWTVYRHKGPDGRVYIGITKQQPERRWEGGLGYQRSNGEFFRYILAVGWNNIQHEIICTELTEGEAREMEREMIAEQNLRAFNVVHATSELKAVPEVKTMPDNVCFYDALSDAGRRAVDMAAYAWFGEVNEDTRYRAWEKHYHSRTMWELESGDPVRIAREVEYMAKLADTNAKKRDAAAKKKKKRKKKPPQSTELTKENNFRFKKAEILR